MIESGGKCTMGTAGVLPTRELPLPLPIFFLPPLPFPLSPLFSSPPFSSPPPHTVFMWICTHAHVHIKTEVNRVSFWPNLYFNIRDRVSHLSPELAYLSGLPGQRALRIHPLLQLEFCDYNHAPPHPVFNMWAKDRTWSSNLHSGHVTDWGIPLPPLSWFYTVSFLL